MKFRALTIQALRRTSLMAIATDFSDASVGAVSAVLLVALLAVTGVCRAETATLHFTNADLDLGPNTSIVVTDQYASAWGLQITNAYRYIDPRDHFSDQPNQVPCLFEAAIVPCNFGLAPIRSLPSRISFIRPVLRLTFDWVKWESSTITDPSGNRTTKYLQAIFRVLDRSGREIATFSHTAAPSETSGTHSVSGEIGSLEWVALEDDGSPALNPYVFISNIAYDYAGPACPLGTTVDVTLPAVSVPVNIPNKPWSVDYGALPLQFAVGRTQSTTATCMATSNAGSLPVIANYVGVGGLVKLPLPLGVRSSTVTTVTLYKPGFSIGSVPSCFIGGAKNDCSLNGVTEGHVYLGWNSPDGFSTSVYGYETPFSTGPLNFFVDLTTLGLAEAAFPTILSEVESYIHEELIKRLPSIAWYTIIQDPGMVRLYVADAQGNLTGETQSGFVETRIPGSFYLKDDLNPAVFIVNPDNGEYRATVVGVKDGPYSLSIAAVTSSQLSHQTAEGTILAGQSVEFMLSVTNGQGSPIATLALAEPEPSSGSGAGGGGAVDALSLIVVLLAGLMITRGRTCSSSRRQTRE